MSLLKSTTRGAKRLAGDLVGLSRVLTPSDAMRYAATAAGSLVMVARARTLAPVDARMAGRRYAVRLGRAHMSIRGEHFSGIREMYARSVYFVEPRCQLPRSGWVVDLGANVGLFTLLAACSGLRVVAVEAQPGFVPEILRNLQDNQVDAAKVKVLCGLLGPGAGVLAGEGWKQASHAGSEPPPHLGIHEVLAPLGSDRVGFLKMDIEGSEFDLLQGDCDWLNRVDCLAAEIHARFGAPRALVDLLTRMDFEVAWRSPDLRRCAPGADDGYLYAWRHTSPKPG